MSDNLATSQTNSVRQFSIRQAFVAILGLAIGLAIWRSPKGDGLDIPIAMLGFYFVISLTRHAAAQWRNLADASGWSNEQRWGARLKLWGLVGLAMVLAVALFLRALGANGMMQEHDPDRLQSGMYVQFSSLPRDLALLAMLCALGVNHGAPRAIARPAIRRKVYGALAAAGLLIAILVYVMNYMIVTALVYVAVSGIENYQSARIVPPEMNVPTALRRERFIVASFIGIAFLLANLILILTIRKWWSNRLLRWLLLPLIVSGITGQCIVVHWFVVYGIRQLQPEFADTFFIPPFAGAATVALIIVVGCVVAAWKMSVRPPVAAQNDSAVRQIQFFHETWLASALLGTCAAALFVNWIINSIVDYWWNPPFYNRFGWKVFPASFVYYPWELIWWAAAIGGLSTAWIRWRGRANPIVENSCEIDPLQFAIAFVALFAFTLAAAPILAAAGFSYGLMRYPTPF